MKNQSIEYNRNNYKQYGFRLRKKANLDSTEDINIINWLAEKRSVNEYIKNLIKIDYEMYNIIK